MKARNSYIISGVIFLAFIVFTFLVLKVDVQAIGPENSSIGFATLNQSVFEKLGENQVLYKLTTLMGVVAILVAMGFAALGCIQAIKRKNPMKVDKDIIVLGGYYILVVAAYVFFEKVIINYRPVITDEGLEASYPSSHTIIVFCIIGAAMIEFHKRIENKTLKNIIQGVSALIIIFTVVGRLLSGVHWFTDIIGGVLLSVSLVFLFAGLTTSINSKQEVEKK